MVQNEEQHLQSREDGAAKRYFGAVLGFEHVPSQEGTAVIELKVQEDHCNLHGSVHGGVLMSLMDAAGLWAGAQKDGAQKNGAVPAAVTASINCNFLRGARFGQIVSLRAEGQVTKRGRSMYFSSISVYAVPGGDLIASGQGVYGIVPPRPQPAMIPVPAPD